MDLFSTDKNGNFILNLNDNIVVDLESLFAKIKSFSLKLEEEKEFEFEDISRTQQKFIVYKIDANSYQLKKMSIKHQNFQVIYLYEKVNLIKENNIYPIYSELQVNYLIEKKFNLKVEECSYFLIEEDKNERQINLEDFEHYPGRNIEIKVGYKNESDCVFKRKRSDEKKLIDLTLNLNGLFENQELDDKVFEGEGRKQFQKELDSLYLSVRDNFKYYCGQSGIGKTVSLLDYRYKTYHNILYLNMNILFKVINFLTDFHQALKNELIYLFNSYDNYNSFIEAYGKDIFLSSFENVDLNKLRFTIIEKLIDKLLSHFKKKAEKIMIIIDQYIKKHDYGLTDKLEKFTQNNKYIKFVCCCSTDEIDVRENIHNSIFEKKNEKKKFISINNLIKIDLSFLTDKQKKVSEMFGNSPKYFYRIKNTKDKELDSLKETLKEEIYNDVRKSIKKMNIENEVIYGLLIVMYNIKKKIDKAKLKSLFKYIFLKFITITVINTKDKYFINFWEEKEENFIINYSFPIIKSVFRMILKEYKKKEYKQHLIDCTEAEEGYILEHLIYLSLESGERPFVEELKIFKSYEVVQVFCLSKFFVDANEKEKLLKSEREDYINGLFEIGKNYHLFQNNENGPKFDGALLISAQKNNIEEEDNMREKSKINLEEDINNENEKTIKKKDKIYDLIIYQSTKKKEKNRADNNFVIKNKDMIIKNFELLFNIKIRKLNFIYILEYEKQDKSLITFCELIENQISYIFYSLENNKFVNRNGVEIRISKYITDIRSYKNVIQYINTNKERNEKFLKQMISEIPNELDVEKGNKFLTKKRNKDKEKKFYKKTKNFLCFYDSDDNLILNKDINKTSKTNYENEIKENKQKFFDNFIVEVEEKDNNEIYENQSDLESKDKNKEELIKDIVCKDRHTKEFSLEYNKKIKNIILKMFSGNKEIIKTLNDKNIISYYSGIYEINILNNLINFPFYYLYRNKETKDTKIFIKDNNIAKMFNYVDENEIKGDDYENEINSMMDVEKFNKDNIIMSCFIVNQELKRETKLKKDKDYEYNN